MFELARSQDAYDRFSAAVDGPLTVLAVLWLPVLVVPLAARVSPATSDALDAVDYAVWAVFACSGCCACSAWPGPRSS